jgi:hypothetical protein
MIDLLDCEVFSGFCKRGVLFFRLPNAESNMPNTVAVNRRRTIGCRGKSGHSAANQYIG